MSKQYLQVTKIIKKNGSNTNRTKQFIKCIR